MVFCSCLLSLFLLLRVSPVNAGGWSINVPEEVAGLSGSCVEIPCTFSYPEDGKKYTTFTAVWYNGLEQNDKSTAYHTDASKIIQAFKGRTSLIGNLNLKECSLKISSLLGSDSGPYVFRIEIENLNKYTYKDTKVSISLKDSPEQPTVSVNDEVTSGESVIATCAVLHPCPSELPSVTWTHNGRSSIPSQPQNHGQWKLTYYNLTFTPSREDHDKSLSCFADFNGKRVAGHKTLKVKYPPYNVNVETSKPSVRENDSAELTCSSNSNPPAHSYQWFSSSGKVLGDGHTHKLERVSRHSEAISCEAINSLGRNSSVPQKINVLYPPEIKNESSCHSAGFTVCICIVESNPPSEVKWFGSDSSKTFPSSSNKQNESLTIFTVQSWLGLPKNIQCFARNSLGNSSIVLEAPQNGLIICIAVASAIVVVIVGVLVYVVRRHCGNRATQHPVMKNEMKKIPELSDYKNKEENGSDDGIYTNCPDGHVYNNFRRDERTTLSGSVLEDDSIYANY